MLLGSFEDRLRELGCRKINLLVAADNAEVVEFYRAAGYDREEMLFLERWL
jgi:ribosomal protein S18 acetylase RimI-like enzyme